MRPEVRLDHYTSLAQVMNWVNLAETDKDKVERLEACIFKLPSITMFLQCYYEVNKPYTFNDVANYIKPLRRNTNGVDDESKLSFQRFVFTVDMYADAGPIVVTDIRYSKLCGLLDWLNDDDADAIQKLVHQQEIEFLTEFGLGAYELFKDLNKL